MAKIKPKYNAQTNSTIRYNIIDALQNLAKYNGVDISKIQHTLPWSTVLGKIPTQKMARELKNLIDSGMVVKGIARGQSTKYMLREVYEELFKKGKRLTGFGYGDYRDKKKPHKEVNIIEPVDKDFLTPEEEEEICRSIAAHPFVQKYEFEW